MDLLSEKEKLERSKLVGYCDHCAHYTKFTRGVDLEQCEKCGGRFSTQHGFQITTQRTPKVGTKKGKGR